MIDSLTARVIAGERRALAKAITLVESQLPKHQAEARVLLNKLLPHSGRSLRIGITGNPGAGKSTFIERLGLEVIAQGHRVAVLAIDPSSSVTGGSILGDKTRMEQLSVQPQAFIRPSPAGTSLGGVAARTREAMLVCEAAGFDVLIVETVGVGQSETAVAGMTDIFVLLQLPNAGDELQAMKKGIVELADLIVVNKEDLDPRAAQQAANQISSVLRLLQPAETRWKPEVMTTSAATGTGIAQLWSRILACRDHLIAAGTWDRKRQHQALSWTWQLVELGLRERFHAHPAVQEHLDSTLGKVAQGKSSASAAAAYLLDLLDERSR